MNTILTKVNKIELQFKDYCFLKKATFSEGLKKFVEHCHPKQEIIICGNSIQVFNKNSHYIYSCLKNDYSELYYQRVNTDTGKKVFYKIS